MSYGYGAQQNPFDQRDDGGYNAPSAGYGQQSYNTPPAYNNRYNQEPTMGSMNENYGGQNVEMNSLAQNAGSFGQQDPNAILNECRDIDRGIDAIEREIEQVKMTQVQAINTVDAGKADSVNRDIEARDESIMSTFRTLSGRVKAIQRLPEHQSSRNAPQVGKVDRRLKATLHQYQTTKAEFRKNMRTQMERQYRIVRPDASEEEIRAAVDDPSPQQQVFQQALMQSNRRNEAQNTLRNVQNRHEAIQKIEQQLIELAQLFEEMNQAVEMQEASIVNIEAKGEEVVEHMDKANEQISTAIVSARSRNRKKWWCLLICVIIVVIIVVVVVVYTQINKSTTSSTKRSLPNLNARRVMPGASFHETQDSVVPGLKWSGRRFVIADKNIAESRAVSSKPAITERIVNVGAAWAGDN